VYVPQSNARRTVAVALSLLLVLEAVTSGTAHAAPVVTAPSAAPAVAVEREPQAEAEPVELPAERTTHTRTLANPDGTFTTHSFAAPIHYEDAEGDLQPIDLRAVASSRDGVAFETAGAPVTTRLGTAAGDDVVTVVGGGHQVAFRPLKSTSHGATDEVMPVVRAPRADGTVVTYDEIYPGVDLRFTLLPSGVKEDLVLESAAAAADFAFAIDAPGLRAMPADHGGLTLDDAHGPVFELPAPFMTDAAGERTDAVSYRLGEQGGETAITVAPDPEWLAASERAYPVAIDPTTLAYDVNRDTYISSSEPSTSHNTVWNSSEGGYYELRVGYDGSGTNVAYVRTGHPNDVTVLGADFHAYVQHAGSGGTASDLELAQLTDSFIADQTWNMTQPTYTALGTEAVADNAWAVFDVTDVAQDWASGTINGYGFRLSAASNDPGLFKRLRAMGSGSNIPYLEVTWARSSADLLAPIDGAHASGRTLVWDYDDNGSGLPQAEYRVQVATTDTFSGGSIVAQSGFLSGTTEHWTVPAGLLTENTTYYWRVRVFDGTTWSVWGDSWFVHSLANLGMQPQHSIESWDLGAGDQLGVNVASANLLVSHPLVTLPFRGSQLAVNLSFNAHDPANVGLGVGWRLNLQRRLTLNGDGSVTFVDADGARHRFTNPSTVGSVTTYTRPPALYATLVKDTSAAAEFSLTYRDLSIDEFDISGSEALLTRAEDRFGNGVDLAYSSGNLSTVTDPNSRQLSFTWDTGPTPDRLTSFTDWAYISGGVVQASATGSLRTYRFFYDGSGRLAGWSDPLNTAGSCPAGGSHLTCLTYASGQLTEVKKTQTVTTFASGSLGTTTRTITTAIAYDGDRVSTVTDAEQQAQGSPQRTSFELGTDGVSVERPTTTTRYEPVGGADHFARVASSFRVFDGSTEIERAVDWDDEFPILPASVTDNAGAVLNAPARTVSYVYDSGSLGLLEKLTEPLNATDDRWTEHIYNANHDVTQTIVSAEGSGAERTITRFCYDAGCTLAGAGLAPLAQIDAYVDGVGGSGAGLDDHDTDVRTEYVSDAYGQVTRVIRHNRDATGATLDDREDRFSFDASGNQTAEIVNYANGAITSPGDDVTPNTTTLARTDLTTTHTYDTAGNRVSTTDPRRAIEAAKGTSLATDDFITRWTFDALNQQLSQETPTTPGLASTQASASSTFDELGMIRATDDFGGLVSATEFDRAGRTLREFTDPPGTNASVISIATHDADGRTLTIKDERQVDDAGLGVTSFVYDALGRETSMISADATSSEAQDDTAWDGLDRRVTLEVGVGAGASLLTTYAYDLGGRVVETDDGFACGTGTFDYRDLPAMAVSGLAGGTCASGADSREVTHTHDGLGRLTRSEVTDGADDGDRTLDDVFDAVGNLRSASVLTDSVTSTTTFSLNLLDQLVVESRADGSTAKTTYDAAGNPIDRCFWSPGATVSACQAAGNYPWTNPPTTVTTSAYDARNGRVSLADPAAGSVTTYNPDHNYAVSAVHRATGSGREHQALYTYDERHRLTDLDFQTCAANSSHACTDTPVANGSDTYAYDDNHSRTQVIESNGATSSDRRYCYDARNQLTFRNTGAACSSGSNDESWTYDDAGNRLTAVSGPSTTNFAYDADGLLCDVETGAAANCSGGNVTHDSAGRIESWNAWTFGYDAEGRLVTACKSSNCAAGHDKLEFTYDGEGHRTEIVATAANATVTTTEFRYQGDAVVEERVNGTVVRQFVTDESGAISKLIVPAGLTDAGTYLVNWNGHGDALNLLRVNGDGTTTLANTFTYDTWGTPTSATHNGIGDLGFRYLYVGQLDVQWDNLFGLGLHYMNARHFAPQIGRFLQPDPIRAELNPYRYAENRPTTLIDPAGTCPTAPAVALGPWGWIFTGVTCGVPAIITAAKAITTAAAVAASTVVLTSSNIQTNAERGRAAEREVGRAIRNRPGRLYVRSQVYFSTVTSGRPEIYYGRRYDFCVYSSYNAWYWNPKRPLWCIEVKSGAAAYKYSKQWYKDQWISARYGFPVNVVSVPYPDATPD
jgi:RHS repeat-associated protein